MLTRLIVAGFATLGCSLVAQQGSPQGTNGSGGQGAAGATAGATVGGSTAGSSAMAGASAGGAGGGSGATGGGGGMGGSVVSEPPVVIGPPYPFPQNKRSQYCSYPSNVTSAQARTAYDRWKRDLVTSEGANGFFRVRRPNTEMDTTVSEGIGYGMILSVVMGDQPVFDGLWKYSQRYLNDNQLMHWQVNSAGMVIGEGAATDADEDMAWALILADKKWGGSGSLGMAYVDVAKAQIDRIWNHEVDHGRGDLLLAGDSWGETVAVNPSYFAPNQYRAFAKVSGNAGWSRVIDNGYALLNGSLRAEFGNAQNGLIAAWTDPSGKPSAPFDGAPLHYQYDSARIPFRIGMDFCDFGEPRAKAYLDKIVGFFSTLGAANIVDGYELNGTARAENAGTQSALFVGAAAVGAMSDAKYRPFLDNAYSLLTTKDMLPPSYYFNLSWQVFSLLMMSGNLFDYTLHP